MMNEYGLDNPTTTSLPLQAADAIDEVDVGVGVEVGFIIATSCTSLELEEDDDLLEETLSDDEDISQER